MYLMCVHNIHIYTIYNTYHGILLCHNEKQNHVICRKKKGIGDPHINLVQPAEKFKCFMISHICGA
jgi:hypothetical protein